MANGTAPNAKDTKSEAKSKAKAKAAAALPVAARLGRANSMILAGDKAEAKKSRNLVTEANRLLKKWFPTISDQQKYSHVVDGKSLFDFTCEAKVQHATKGTYFEEDFWTKAAAKYDIDMAVRPCTVINAAEVVDTNLVTAITACTTKNMKERTKSAIIAHFKQGKDMNQRSICGLVAELVKLNPSANADTAAVFLEFMKLILKHKLHERFKQDCAQRVQTYF